MKHQKLMLGVLAFVLAAAGVLFIIDANRTTPLSQNPDSPTPSNQPASTFINGGNPASQTTVSNIVVPSPSLAPLPTTDTITSSGIQVANFYKLNSQRNSWGDTTIVKTEKYSISYTVKSDSFLISISGSPFENYRPTAEQALLTLLNVSQTDACKLKVSITSPRFANPEQEGITHRLSFCK